MQFAPKSEKEIREAQLWPKGDYAFEVLDRALLGGREYATCETRSQNGGKDMIQLILRVSREGQQRIIVDYLMPEMPAKLRHAADACGLIDEYEAGELLAEDFIGSRGTLKLRVEKDKSGQYPDKNAVADYVPGSFLAGGQIALVAE